MVYTAQQAESLARSVSKVVRFHNALGELGLYTFLSDRSTEKLYGLQLFSPLTKEFVYGKKHYSLFTDIQKKAVKIELICTVINYSVKSQIVTEPLTRVDRDILGGNFVYFNLAFDKGFTSNFVFPDYGLLCTYGLTADVLQKVLYTSTEQKVIVPLDVRSVPSNVLYS